MSKMCEEELQLMVDKCHSLQAKYQMLKEDVVWYKDQIAELERIKQDQLAELQRV
jgi:uncharacterized protein YlxW (UPF0749 family)